MGAWHRVAVAVVAAVIGAVLVTSTGPAATLSLAAAEAFTPPASKPVPCPYAKPTVKRSHPPRPAPPAADPASRRIGGDALDTSGLVVPQGMRLPPAVTAKSWLVADLDTGQVLGACGPHEYWTPASVQKLLLAATVMPRLDPDKVITVTKGDMDFEPGSSAVGLLMGGRYSIRTLWLGLLLNSGNDAANVLARLGGGAGGVPATMAAMNAEARRLGALQTHAVTPSGLDGKGQFTSAYDLALIARACFANADFRRYVHTKTAKIPAQPPRDKRGFQIQNDNTLLFRYSGALGGKTGYTDLARHTYMGAAERGGRRLVVTLLGAEAHPLRGWEQGAKLLDWGFSLPRDVSVGRLVKPGEVGGGGASELGRTGSPPARSTATSLESVSMLDSVVGAAVLLASATPVVLLMTVLRRRAVRRRRLSVQRPLMDGRRRPG